MERRNFYWTLFLILTLTGLAICEDRNSVFTNYNPDLVIQSASISEGLNLEYSIPDLTTFSHLRLSAESDSIIALHMGVGYATIDVGFSTHFFNWQNNSVRFMLILGISGAKTAYFGQTQLITSLYRNKKSEIGANFSIGYNLYLPAEIYYEDNSIDQIAKDYKYAGQPDLFLKQELYFMFQYTESLNIGIASGVTEGIYFDNSGDLFRFQFGASLKYSF